MVPLPKLPVLYPSVLAGAATLMVAILAYVAWLRALPRSVCPRCREPTLPIGGPIRSLDRWFRRRWCGGCTWSGWGRNGPVHWPERGPVADGSGFRWGEERLEPDLGFRWAAAARPEAGARHPSGFRWAEARGPERSEVRRIRRGAA